MKSEPKREEEFHFSLALAKRLEKLSIELLMSTAFHQETNGQVERANKTIMQIARIFP